MRGPANPARTRAGPRRTPQTLGQKNCRTKVSRIFGFCVPDFAPNFAPNFPRIFRGFFVLRFVGNGDQKKFTKNPRHFSMQNSQANTKNIFTKKTPRRTAEAHAGPRRPTNPTQHTQPREPRPNREPANPAQVSAQIAFETKLLLFIDFTESPLSDSHCLKTF